MGIGTATPSSKLHVVGGDVRVTGGAFIDDGVTLVAPDYVFDPAYALLPLDQLAAFVARERHLPNLPSADEIKANGVNLSQFQMLLLEKIEELTLYTIEQARRLEQSDALLARQESLLRELQGRLEALEGGRR